MRFSTKAYKAFKVKASDLEDFHHRYAKSMNQARLESAIHTATINVLHYGFTIIPGKHSITGRTVAFFPSHPSL